jgi:hypothetical protein
MLVMGKYYALMRHLADGPYTGRQLAKSQYQIRSLGCLGGLKQILRLVQQ